MAEAIRAKGQAYILIVVKSMPTLVSLSIFPSWIFLPHISISSEASSLRWRL